MKQFVDSSAVFFAGQCNFEPLFMHNFENEYYLEFYLRLKKTRQGLQLTCQEGW